MDTAIPTIRIVDDSFNGGNDPWPLVPKWTGDNQSYLDLVRKVARESGEYNLDAVIAVEVDDRVHSVHLGDT